MLEGMDTPIPLTSAIPMRVAPNAARELRAVILRELRQITTGSMPVLLGAVLPLVGWVLLRSVFGAHVVRDLPVVVIDRDNSVLSRRVSRAIDATSVVRVVERRADDTDAEGVLLRGIAYAVVVLPAGLQRAVARGDRMPVQLFTNGQWMLPASLIARDVRAAVSTLSVELDVTRRAARAEPVAQARITSEPVRSVLHPLYNPSLDYAAFLFLALVPTLLHVFVLALSVQAIGEELKRGTAGEWIAVAGDRAVVAAVGKLAPYTVWFTALGIAMLEGAVQSLTLPIVGHRVPVYAGLLLLVLAYQAIALLLVSVTANFRLSCSLAAFIAGPAFAVAGVSFPRPAMPTAAQVWADALPLSHYLQLQTAQIIAGAPADVSLPLCGILSLFVSVLPALSLRRLGTVARTPAYWGRV
jgi:ABC-2 type transport system permease protein